MALLADPVQPFLQQQGFMVLDGAMATELERHGADLNDPLWSARCLLESPESIQRVHNDYLLSGADVLISATYQASVAGFQARGLDKKTATDLLRLGVELALMARDEFWSQPANQHGRLKPLVAASVGPFGACQSDGSEYHGNYTASWSEVATFHRDRLEVLTDCGADLLAFETIPSLQEAEILLELLEQFPVHAWLSFSCRDEEYLSHGELFSSGITLAEKSAKVCAAGVNCTPPKFISALLQQAQHSTLPLLVYPNSGETWEPETKCWTGQGGGKLQADAWYRLGARLIGGCCRTDPGQISNIRAVLESVAIQRGNKPRVIVE